MSRRVTRVWRVRSMWTRRPHWITRVTDTPTTSKSWVAVWWTTHTLGKEQEELTGVNVVFMVCVSAPVRLISPASCPSPRSWPTPTPATSSPVWPSPSCPTRGWWRARPPPWRPTSQERIWMPTRAYKFCRKYVVISMILKITNYQHYYIDTPVSQWDIDILVTSCSFLPSSSLLCIQ